MQVAERFSNGKSTSHLPSSAKVLALLAERFSNQNSSSDLPSSAKVLALLAAGDADDATVQQVVNAMAQLAVAMDQQ